MCIRDRLSFASVGQLAPGRPRRSQCTGGPVISVTHGQRSALPQFVVASAGRPGPMGRRRRAGRVVGSVVVVLLLGAGGYVAADAYDVVPGRLTLEPPAPTPVPFPTAPAVVAAPAPQVAVDHLDPEAPMPSPEAVGALANALVDDPRMGSSTAVTLGLDDTLFTGPAWNPGWHPTHNLYVAPIAALAVDRGATSPDPFRPRQADPALEATKAFAALLTAQGITVTGLTRMTADPAAVEIAAVGSAPIREIIRYTIRESDNTVAALQGDQ